MIEYSGFWFVLLITIGIIFIALAIYVGLKIVYGITIEDLQECIKQGIPPKLCIVMFPQPPLQGVNYTR